MFGDRCFSIEKRHLDILGYGRDHSGSSTYLADTLALILPYNNNGCVFISLSNPFELFLVAITDVDY